MLAAREQTATLPGADFWLSYVDALWQGEAMNVTRRASKSAVPVRF